mmetsp:Transcript_33020/g.93474  ORF Transcript_33020/g.93474 Transcript_33020/m.93474 type:complete len:115 (+) Transcript_33020:135-479(+)|eukprot:CAMPEP_0117679934 /NCGR_PEP_ID=MMETSP0804-20121206/18071_1 /TAXON_ID=1074897 /ORGANISM="Tetraselmis astigmatica, Strain CCMP880" /LENGTH=114 /DNA_ID=CAMNT_0005489373 /DNA_START=86 /DNA_END=430 /DNA_ORIENTATION=+
MNLVLLKLAGALAGTGVAAEAVGAHGFKEKDEKFTNAWRSGARLQTLHGVALLALASAPLSDTRLKLTGAGLALGTLLFSGGCYGFAIMEDKKYSKIAPYGGMLMIGSWLSLVF